jgi:ABC-type glycerol-3-phosphate transport system permease component
MEFFVLALGRNPFEQIRSCAGVAVAANRMSEDTSWANLFSAAIAGSLPPVVVFLFLQKYFIQGISGTGLKT